MERLRVALLNAAYNGDGAWENFSRDVPVKLTNYNAVEGKLPDHDTVDAAIVTGSKASTYWDEQWIDELEAWLREADDRGIALLGVCFGHQIMAQAIGGKVEDMEEYELGYHEVRRIDDSPLFDGLGERFTVFCTHHDAVTAIPPGAEVHAETDAAVQAYRRKDSFGVQFHPEFDRATAERVIDGKELPEERIADANATVTEENITAAEDAKRLFENFVSYAASRTVAADD
jgi:GMP synthase (glutamine-hydrolysing)